jgi:hypothetical protein
MVSRLIAQMVESGLLARRGKQYVLLKKWNFTDNRANSQKAIRRSVAASAQSSSTLAPPAGSSNGSASRGVTAYAARGAA